MNISGVCVIMATCLSLFAWNDAHAQVNQKKAATVKGLYVYYLPGYTNWPKTAFKKPTDPIVIGVMGKDPFGVAAALEKKIAADRAKRLKAKLRPIALRRLTYAGKPANPANPGAAGARLQMIAQLKGCHALVLMNSEKKRWGDLQTIIKGLPVLTIAEFDGFAKGQGVIQFVLQERGKYVGMHVNLEAAKKSGLQIRAGLLAIKRVKVVKNVPKINLGDDWDHGQMLAVGRPGR